MFQIFGTVQLLYITISHESLIYFKVISAFHPFPLPPQPSISFTPNDGICRVITDQATSAMTTAYTVYTSVAAGVANHNYVCVSSTGCTYVGKKLMSLNPLMFL